MSSNSLKGFGGRRGLGQGNVGVLFKGWRWLALQESVLRSDVQGRTGHGVSNTIVFRPVDRRKRPFRSDPSDAPRETPDKLDESARFAPRPYLDPASRTYI